MRLTSKAVAELTLLAGKTDMITFDSDLPGFGYRLRRGAGGKVRAEERAARLGPRARYTDPRWTSRAKTFLANHQFCLGCAGVGLTVRFDDR